jgi:chemotaxis protein CheZ
MNTSITASGISAEETFARLGRITRQLHEAMSELGLEKGLIAVANEIPDARDRLSHVGYMTESAATEVLNVIDMAQPQCQAFKEQSRSMAQAIEQLRTAGTPRTSEVNDVLATCQMFTGEAVQFADTQSTALVDIMMTQDFQDLSGQIIKKVIDIISLTEKQLLSLLMHSAPEHLHGMASDAELAGPQVPNKALKQDDVDDLLASLGF